MTAIPELVYSKQVEGKNDLPARARTMRDALQVSDQPLPSNVMQGLEKVQASGSAQFGANNIAQLVDFLKKAQAKEIVVVDLRRESHCFINGMPFTWYLSSSFNNMDKSFDEIEQDEHDRLKILSGLASSGKVKVLKLVKTAGAQKIDPTNVIEIPVQDLLLEKDMAKLHGLDYYRIPITDRLAPSKHAIDRLLNLYMRDKSKWFHFHCNAGHGRTTTFLALFDIMHNAREVALETILIRQKLIGAGGAPLLRVSAKNGWQAAAQTQRLQILKEFHTYCADNNDGYQTLFSVWLGKHKELASELPILEDPTVDLTGFETE